jgi:hypothetical protein
VHYTPEPRAAVLPATEAALLERLDMGCPKTTTMLDVRRNMQIVPSAPPVFWFSALWQRSALKTEGVY